MKELLEYILSSLVNYPDEVKVDEQVLPDGMIIFSISANADDYGRIIGRQGMLISALRTIVKARAIKEKKRVMVRVMTEDKENEVIAQAPVAEVATQEVEVTENVSEAALDDNLI